MKLRNNPSHKGCRQTELTDYNIKEQDIIVFIISCSFFRQSN